MKAADPQKTIVSDVVYRADGTTAKGTILISWPAFSTADGKPVAAGSMSVKIGANGAVNIALIPTQGATPTGTAYKVTIALDDGSSSTEYWAVPALSPTTIAAIRATQVPATVAMQVVSRDYVDAQLATAVRSNGDESIAGEKTFENSPLVPPPGTETAAANKAYVDNAIAGAVPSAGNVLNVNKGGTGTSAFTASRCVRVADDGNSLESASSDCGSGDATSIHGASVAVPASTGGQATFNGSGIEWQSKVAVDARDYAGTDCGLKIQAAHDSALSATGGTIDARGCSGPATITGFTITKPTRLLLCNSQWTLATATSIAVRADLVVEGCDREGTSITSAANSAIFTPSGTAVKRMEVAHLTLAGGSGASQVIVFPDYQDGVNDFSQGMYAFEDDQISGFGAPPIQLGKSTYMVEITGNAFSNNHGGVIARRDSEPYISRNQFWNQAGGPAIWLYGHSLAVIDHNDFEVDNAGSTDPDILFTPDAAGNSGYIWISRNKFGPEGDSATRYKIRIAPMAGDTVPRIAINVRLEENNFGGVDGQKAVRIESPIVGFLARDNFVNSISTFLSEAQPASSAFTEGAGGGNAVFDTRVLAATTGGSAFTLCENGCRTFSRADAPLGVGTPFDPLTARPRDNETAGLSNYLLDSENFSGAGWTLNGVTATGGQTDPVGTARAFLLTRNGSGASESVGQVLQAGNGPTVTCSVWAKSGSSNRFAWNLYDTTTGMTVSSQAQYLDASWRRFKLNFAGMIAGHGYRVLFYPDGFNTSTKTVYLFGAQCSDLDSDYIPTASAKVVDTTRGNRWEREVEAAGGIVTTRISGIADTTVVNNLNADSIDGKHAVDLVLSADKTGTGAKVPSIDASPADGCAQLASGKIVSTGSACGAGGGATSLGSGTTVSLTAPRQYYVCTSACTVTPPAPAAGYEFCVMNDNNVSTVITLAALGSSSMYENTARTAYGTAGTGTLVSSGAVGDKVCIVGRDSTHYLTTTYTGSWTAN